MANTGLLPFVRGVDFTSNDFSVSGKPIIVLLSIIFYTITFTNDNNLIGVHKKLY